MATNGDATPFGTNTVSSSASGDGILTKENVASSDNTKQTDNKAKTDTKEIATVANNATVSKKEQLQQKETQLQIMMQLAEKLNDARDFVDLFLATGKAEVKTQALQMLFQCLKAPK